MAAVNDGWDSVDPRVEAVQMATINVEARVSALEQAVQNDYGGIPVNQDELMTQMLSQTAAGSTALNYDEVEKIRAMMAAGGDVSQGVAENMWGGTTLGSVPTASSNYGKEIGVDAGMIDIIVNIRNKLDEFLDGSNILVKIMNPQTVREMVREMRHEIRMLKQDHGISELAIIEHLEKECDREADMQAQAERDYRNDIPF